MRKTQSCVLEELLACGQAKSGLAGPRRSQENFTLRKVEFWDSVPSCQDCSRNCGLRLAAQPEKLVPMLAAVLIIFESEWSDM